MINLDGNKPLNIIALPNNVLFPGKATSIKVNKMVVDKFYQRIAEDDYYGIALAVKENSKKVKFNKDDFYHIGTLIRIEDMKPLNNGYQLRIDVIERIEVKNFIEEDKHLKATFEIIPDQIDLDIKNQKEILSYMKSLVHEISDNFKGSEAYVNYIEQVDDINHVIAYLLPFMNLSFDEKQAFLEMSSLRRKSLRFLDILIEQKESIKFQMEMSSKFNKETNKAYREHMLKQQLKAIQDELNESEGKPKSRKKDYKDLIEKAKMPEDVNEVALDELDKLERQPPNSAEKGVIRNYLDLLTNLAWVKNEPKSIDIEKARALLDEDHYGLDKVKDRIIQHISVMKLKKNKQGSILLLVGPPGTGKTSLGKSVAKVLERKYIRVSLGGVRDEAEIRGHRRTYIGALPGRIIQGMKRAGEVNPVFILDEIDKVMSSVNGDPASALLEVLDPEQNNSFFDHYLDVPYDLSDVFFIATANSLRNIPEPLRDRMEIIEISSYTRHEKFHIAKKHLVSEVLEEHGLTEEQLQFDDDMLHAIIEKYTREAGVRGLKRQLSTLTRVASEKIVTGKVGLPFIIKKEMLFDLLGHEIARFDRVEKANPPGVVTGMAWTPVGGQILFIEGAFMPGNGKLTLTGQMGDVMKESAKIAQTLIRSRLAFAHKAGNLRENDLHIHIPAGAIPKDGPSAGVALFTTIASLVTNIQVDSKLAMTGEISLRGVVLPVGGIKEKVLAAHRSGIKRIILPKDNEKDILDIPEEVRNELKFILVETIEDVLKETIGLDLPEQMEFGMKEDIIQKTEQ